MPPVKKEPDAPVQVPVDASAEELAALRARIEAYESAERQRETGAFTGVARCVNPACKVYDTSQPIALQIDVKETRDEQIPALVIATHEYLHPVDDADLECPKCGTGRAIMAQEPPTYAPLAPR